MQPNAVQILADHASYAIDTGNEVARMTSMSRTMMNKYREQGRFPQHVDLGDRRVAFVKAGIVAWIPAEIEARTPPQNPVGLDQLRAKLAQAYEVIAILLLGPEGNSLDVAMPEGKRALKYFRCAGYDARSCPSFIRAPGQSRSGRD
ncbi:AlpA family transcriptional regulator [Rhizobium azibense]|uniref:AlpA family transcriptional regulator n=2 Tax=Rhizobium azibense TaxID=1136135 RepID=A0A4R3QHX1_9HYPH|nr:AlpA family transcriptional regulator [Rhizobium azibense]TCU35066.1 AlpA family transcriptional regulator [Rhizobium azibense]